MVHMANHLLNNYWTDPWLVLADWAMSTVLKMTELNKKSSLCTIRQTYFSCLFMGTLRCLCTFKPNLVGYIGFKGTQAWISFYFFAETETIWFKGPVTRDFWKSYSIRPRYSTFKHLRACSACDEIRSAYAQHAIKFVPRMLSVR